MKKFYLLLTAVLSFNVDLLAAPYAPEVVYYCKDLEYRPNDEGSLTECQIVRGEEKTPVRGCELKVENYTLVLPVTRLRPKGDIIQCTKVCERIGGSDQEECDNLPLR